MKLITRAIDVGWLVGLAIFVLSGIDDVPFHGDESTIIFMSRDYHYLIQERDLDQVLFAELSNTWDEQWLRLVNGTVSKMAIGFAWDMDGLTVDDLNRMWPWNPDWDYNISQGGMPSDHLLRVARWPLALMLVVSAWAVVGMTWLIGQSTALPVPAIRVAAWVASAVYITTPAVLINGRRAINEGSYLCFMNLMMWAALRLAVEQQSSTKTRRGLARWAVVTGILAGWAVASKHTALIAVIAALAALFAEPLIRLPRQPLLARLRSYRWGRWLRFVVMGALALGVFVLLNPAWWSDLTGMPERVYRFRRDFLAELADTHESYASPGERIEGLLADVFWAEPEYYESPNWKNYAVIDAQIATYESRWYAGRRGGLFEASLLIPAFGIGLLWLIRRWRTGPAWVMLVWLVTTTSILLLTNPLNWQRYYIPLSPEVAVMVGLGTGWLAGVVFRRRGAQSDAATVSPAR